MKALLLALLLSGSVGAQTLAFYIDPSNGASPVSGLTPLPSPYQFADTPASASSSVVIRVVNPSSAAVVLNTVFIGNAPGSSAATPNFTVTGILANTTLAPLGSQLFTLHFTPVAAGAVSGYLQALYNGSVTSLATLQGNGTAPQYTLSCTAVTAPQPIPKCDGSNLTPSTTAPINFGNVLTTTTAVVQFTFTNTGTTVLNPQALISLSTLAYNDNPPFQLTPKPLPTTLAVNSSLSLTVTFAPGDTSTTTINLLIGSNSFALQGTGTSSTIGDISSLTIVYTDPTGVHFSAQPATPINFGQTVMGTSGAATLTFTVTNPQTTIDAVTVPSVTVSGAGFTLSGVPTLPAIIAPGQSIAFKVAFSASSTGTYNGTLAIGSRQFPLTGQTVTGLVPSATLTVDKQPLASQEQAHLTITIQSAAAADIIGTLTMQFVPLVTGVASDPAINFVATNGQSLQVKVPAGSQTATYNGQTALTFQTGTTAGTITFTLTFPSSPPFTQSFDIPPAKVQISSITAVRQSPNLVVTLTGYDNTYSAGQLSFTFSTSIGNLVVPVDSTSAFHNYFFTNNQVGGAFSLQASFPVTGDVTQIGSVAVTVTNSAGQTSTTQAFQ